MKINKAGGGRKGQRDRHGHSSPSWGYADCAIFLGETPTEAEESRPKAENYRLVVKGPSTSKTGSQPGVPAQSEGDGSLQRHRVGCAAPRILRLKRRGAGGVPGLGNLQTTQHQDATDKPNLPACSCPQPLVMKTTPKYKTSRHIIKPSFLSNSWPTNPHYSWPRAGELRPLDARRSRTAQSPGHTGTRARAKLEAPRKAETASRQRPGLLLGPRISRAVGVSG